jgi:hypothetical protein
LGSSCAFAPPTVIAGAAAVTSTLTITTTVPGPPAVPSRRSHNTFGASAANPLSPEPSGCFGEPFSTIFERSGRDFYKIDPLLFSPAVVTFVNLTSGKSHQFGQLRPDVLMKSFLF